MDDSTSYNNSNTTTMTFSLGNQITLSIVPKVSSTISIVALIYAIQFIMRSPQRRRILSNRLFLGMYFADLLRCITFVTGNWMIPIGTEGVFMPTGNYSSCAVQAFVSQLGLVVPLYAAAVSGYFVLAIRYNFNIIRYKWAEKWCHVIPISVGLLLAILLVVYKRYGVDGKFN